MISKTCDWFQETLNFLYPKYEKNQHFSIFFLKIFKFSPFSRIYLAYSGPFHLLPSIPAPFPSYFVRINSLAQCSVSHYSPDNLHCIRLNAIFIAVYRVNSLAQCNLSYISSVILPSSSSPSSSGILLLFFNSYFAHHTF